MVKRIIYILFVLIIGIVVAPSNSFACSTKTEKASVKKMCAKEVKDSECLKNCKHNLKDKQACPGKCGEKSCKCPTINMGSAIAIFPQTDKNIFYLFANKGEAPNHKTNLFSGFYDIWTPPNIG